MESVESELVVRYLSKKPGWKESNFQVRPSSRTDMHELTMLLQVGSKMFGVFQLLAEQSPLFAKASAALSIPALSDKLGDMKLKKSAGDALTAYAEKSSLQFVLSQGVSSSHALAPLANCSSFPRSLRTYDEAEGTEGASRLARLGRAGDSRLWNRRSLRARVDRLPRLGSQEHECCRSHERYQDPRHAQALRRIQYVHSLSRLTSPDFSASQASPPSSRTLTPPS